MNPTRVAIIGVMLALHMLAFSARPTRILAQTTSRSAIDFNRAIRPILSNNCFQCHGPDPKVRKAELRLDTEHGAFANLRGTDVIVRGKPAESELIRRISAVQPDKAMPPRKTGKKLTPQEIDLLTRWVKEGAPYARHWAYVKPSRPPLPGVKDASWGKNPIDGFILARLEREGLQPSPEADRHALIRRLSLDLSGLPPTLAEVEAFVNNTDPQAYDRLVDRLLNKKAYGEYWSHMWLDLARYADSAGYADDPPRTIWLFRDYVIKALNANKPFDQFTIEQIAGDLLPSPTEEQLIASAFQRNTLTNNEGGTNDEEFRNVAVVDRVNTTMAVWMGTTINCAQCHDHKYDPITQEEYFRFFALFNNTEDADRTDEAPVLSLFTKDQKRQRQQWQEEIAKLESTLRTSTAQLEADQAKWQEFFASLVRFAPMQPSHGLHEVGRKGNPARRFGKSSDWIEGPVIQVSHGIPNHVFVLDWGHTPRANIEALRTPVARRTLPQQSALAEYYRTTIAPELLPARERLGALNKQLAAMKPVTVPIMRELPKAQRRTTKIQQRGNYLDVGKEVLPGTPALFPPLPAGAPPDRLTLARWLVDENNPLTARVIANRYWEQIFGIGIVASSEEFGAQGETPFHPELLDWLATELVRMKWDVKAFLRLLVTSAAYRQSARVTPELQHRDPDNRLLARGPRFRLSAEMVRDQALFVGGLLSSKMYGPPVKPLQPSLGISAAFGSGIDWQTSAGVDGHRRALYTLWRRSNPYPSMATFDAPTREVCTVRRIRTNTPLQALVTLNDPVYIEAAQALARRIVSEGGPTTSERADYAVRLCLSRPPKDQELARLVNLYEQSFSRLGAQPEQARKLATDPLGPPRQDNNIAELAAWTVVGNVLLNLDEMLMKR
jgi:hypothetical protein